MRELFEYCRDQFFTSVFQDIVLLVALFISVKNRKKFKHLKYFPVYILSLLLTSIFQYVYQVLKDLKYPTKSFSEITEYVDFLFTLIEMVIISHFYYRLIKNHKIKKLIIILNIFFIFFFIYMAIQDRKFYGTISHETQSIVYTVEAIIIFVFCARYFVELFKMLPLVNLRNEPVFWISVGILFFMACTLPYSLLENYIVKNYSDYILMSYSIFNVFYALLFLLVIRAYLCKPEKTI